MAFKFVPVETIKRVIKIEVPGDYDKTTKADFEAEIKRLTVSEARDLVRSIQEKAIDEETVIRENIVSIKGIKDAEGKDMEFTPALLAQLVEQNYIRGPLLAGIFEVNFNLEKLRAKNS